MLIRNKDAQERKNLLTITQNCDIITTKDKEKDTLQTRKAIIMKKATLEIIRDALESINFGDADPDAMAELNAELNRGAEEKAARAAAYESIHSLIVDNLNDTPVTCADLFNEIEPEVLAAGMNKHNVQYALNSLWQDEIEKIHGKPNTYKRK